VTSDGWQPRKWYSPQAHNDGAKRSLARKVVASFVPGNHDEDGTGIYRPPVWGIAVVEEAVHHG
jgi:hypothetical protein